MGFFAVKTTLNQRFLESGNIHTHDLTEIHLSVSHRVRDRQESRLALRKRYVLSVDIAFHAAVAAGIVRFITETVIDPFRGVLLLSRSGLVGFKPFVDQGDKSTEYRVVFGSE